MGQTLEWVRSETFHHMWENSVLLHCAFGGKCEIHHISWCDFLREKLLAWPPKYISYPFKIKFHQNPIVMTSNKQINPYKSYMVICSYLNLHLNVTSLRPTCLKKTSACPGWKNKDTNKSGGFSYWWQSFDKNRLVGWQSGGPAEFARRLQCGRWKMIYISSA